jgi:hypothetical protein
MKRFNSKEGLSPLLRSGVVVEKGAAESILPYLPRSEFTIFFDGLTTKSSQLARVFSVGRGSGPAA